MVVFMANVSVAEAAKRLGVGVPRVHQRIADGSLRAERIGSQWVVDELSLLRVAERKSAGRPLFALVAKPPKSEEDVRRIAGVLRSWFRSRASRELYRAASADLPGLREDVRWAALGGLSAAASGIGAGDLVEGYVAEADVKSLSDDFLLVPAERDANVVVHLLPEGRRAYPDSRLLLAADLAEHRGPREERRAIELLREAGEM